MKRLMVSAPASDSGKTVLTCGLLALLKRRGYTVEAFKCGPDYIDPMFHERVLGVAGRNLDLFLQGEAGVRRALERSCADIALIEGAMGYYDGVGGTDEASAWRVAGVAAAPVVLAVRPRGASTTLAAQLAGLRAFRTPSRIAGVVLMDCKPSLAALLGGTIERECGLPVLGHVPPLDAARLPRRHLGLLTAAEVADCRERFDAVADALERTVDVDALLALAGEPACACDPGMESNPGVRTVCACDAPSIAGAPSPVPPRCTIAVARDEAFCFYYRDSLDALVRAGAELAFFSPLHDAALPPADGLYLGGGYPELHARELAENAPMRAAVAAAVRAGVPTVAECGGFLYLQESLDDDAGQAWPMAGVFAGRGASAGRLVRFGYLTLASERDTLLVHAGEQVPAHEFHHWDCTCNGGDLVAHKRGGNAWTCAFATPSLYAGFPHLHLAGELPLAERFAAAAAAHRDGRAEAPALEARLQALIAGIAGAHEDARAASRARWDGLAKPLGSLGRLEEAITRIAALTGRSDVRLERRVLVVACADNGVVARGVTQCDASVTAAVARALAQGTSTVNYMARTARCEVVPVDVGMRDFCGEPGVLDRRVRNGTDDIACGPAMTRADCLRAVLAGADIARGLAASDADIVLLGEMGIGNTTTTAAAASALLGLDPAALVTRGAGLTSEGLARKVEVVRRALAVNAPDPRDALDVLAKVGGLDLAALAGVVLGGAAAGVPVLMDGVISNAAALAAVRLCPRAADALLASHVSVNPAAPALLAELGLGGLIAADLRLGEGSGAVAALPLLDVALSVYRSGHTFANLGIDAYVPLS